MQLVGQNDGCGDDLTSSSGVIASIDEDSNGLYDNTLDCLWTVRLSIDQVIIFEFREMDIHTQVSRCEGDFLVVRSTPLLFVCCAPLPTRPRMELHKNFIAFPFFFLFKLFSDSVNKHYF